MTLDELNARDHRGFVLALERIFEHSPWVPEAAWQRRPFESFEALYRALVDAMRGAAPEAQLALIRGHPELSGKAASAEALTNESRAEQAGAGLDRCSPDELLRLRDLNQDYRTKFGFPFVIAVRGLDRATILQRLAERLERDRATELEEALQQIERIAWLRLQATIEA
ncbi:MAG TPA: 2-oxo-4-hydroxy-4-carboxy-5-ureidoimidazoline decarboxylase [Casimicrobiaceae bacterium]|jgi:2-oxo-4-hydroxy-4-carboxy-5-ureidoimidazoline decarboxylase|nr:2-oxo-4-hydroxy-4-carboxy-5-ureidoimidazoline decarboxylase [Casimicrobiaceae bacterium]